MRKKIVAAVLAAIVAVGEIPASMYAAETGAFETQAAGSDIAQLSEVDSGSCGNGVTYTLDGEGTLVLSGDGEIAAQAFFERKDIKKVVIEDGITGIGDHAFWGCSALTDADIPSSVKSIGFMAFFQCSNMTSVGNRSEERRGRERVYVSV